jgi:hypothetical protein
MGLLLIPGARIADNSLLVDDENGRVGMPRKPKAANVYCRPERRTIRRKNSSAEEKPPSRE